MLGAGVVSVDGFDVVDPASPHPANMATTMAITKMIHTIFFTVITPFLFNRPLLGSPNERKYFAQWNIIFRQYIYFLKILTIIVYHNNCELQLAPCIPKGSFSIFIFLTTIVSETNKGPFRNFSADAPRPGGLGGKYPPPPCRLLVWGIPLAN